MKVTWKLADGRQIEAEVPDGTSMMQAGTDAGVPEILGDCGGNMACATCHVVVDAEWVAKTGAHGNHEDVMLDTTMAPRQENSRLSCQIIASPSLDGLVLHIPEE